MAEHVRNLLAREGYTFRPSTIQTFSKFLAEQVPDCRTASPYALRLLLEAILDRTPVPAWEAVRDFPGFRQALAGVLEEFAAAGGDAASLAALRAQGSFEAPLAEPLIAILGELEAELAHRGLLPRTEWMRQVTSAIENDGLRGIRRLYLDGFLSFPAPDLGALAALSRQAELTVTLPDWPGAAHARAALRALGLEERVLSGRKATDRPVLVSPPTLEQEVEEICRRILAANRPFREIGVLVRNTARYAPALRTALSRFGIPARFYLAEPLAGHPVVRYFSLLVESARTGFDHEPLLAALTMNLSPAGGTPHGDRLDFQLREQLPNRGLEAIRALDRDSRLNGFLQHLDALGAAIAGSAPAAEWPRRLAILNATLHLRRPSDGIPHEAAHLLRGQSAALRAFEDALGETAAALGPDTLVGFDDFWRKALTVLGLIPLRVPDHRADVVHVIDAWEARQWNLPLVFLCGLLEGEFPAYPHEEPLLADPARGKLQAAGFLVKTQADRQREEDFLWQMALTRASEQLVLSYPRFNEAGEPNLPSFHLAAVDAVTEACVPCRPEPEQRRAAAASPALDDESLRERLAGLHSRWRPTAIESFLQCPFQFFSRYTLRLEGVPPRPEARLDSLAQGNLVHTALAEWHRGAGAMEPLFQRLFEEFCREHRVREGYASELARMEMLRNLLAVVEDPRLEPGWRTEVEQPFEVDLEPGVTISGRIDRYDVSPEDAARLYDYKYSGAAGLARRFQPGEAGRFVQGGLYLLALAPRYRIASFHYCGLKGEVRWRGWEGQVEIRQLMEQARELTLDAVRRITAGDAAARPWSADACGYCEYRDACRIRAASPALAAGAPE